MREERPRAPPCASPPILHRLARWRDGFSADGQLGHSQEEVDDPSDGSGQGRRPGLGTRRVLVLLRFDAALISILVAGIAVLGGQVPGSRIDPSVTLAFLVGVSALVVSLVATVLASRSKELRVGLQAEMIVAASALRPSEEAILREAVLAYGAGLLDNARSLEHATRWMDLALWALLAGVLLLAAGTMSLFVVNAPW